MLLHSIGAGTFGAILAAPVTLLGDIDDVGRRVGLYLAIVALGALAGPPISGAVYAATGDFVAVGVYAGAHRVSGVSARGGNLWALRELHHGRRGNHAVGALPGSRRLEREVLSHGASRLVMKWLEGLEAVAPLTSKIRFCYELSAPGPLQSSDTSESSLSTTPPIEHEGECCRFHVDECRLVSHVNEPLPSLNRCRLGHL